MPRLDRGIQSFGALPARPDCRVRPGHDRMGTGLAPDRRGPEKVEDALAA